MEPKSKSEIAERVIRDLVTHLTAEYKSEIDIFLGQRKNERQSECLRALDWGAGYDNMSCIIVVDGNMIHWARINTNSL